MKPVMCPATGTSVKKWKSAADFLDAGRGHGCTDEARLAQLERDQHKTYGDTPGQLATMPMSDAIVSSPPYERSIDHSENPERRKERAADFRCGVQTMRYGQNPHTFLSKDPSGLNNDERAAIAATNPQIGALEGETFWSAAKQIVAEAFAILKPGGVAVWVVKPFVRNKAIVDFPADWRKLCESVGFVTEREVHAMLVAEETRSHLFDGEVTKRRERKSFFRRLAEKKGSPRIDFEVVYFMVKR